MGNKTSLMKACKNKNEKEALTLIEKYIRKGKKNNSYYSNLDEDFLKKINKTDSKNRSALVHACINNLPNVAIKLIDLGCDLNIQDMNGRTALMYAAKNNETSVIKKLIEKKCDVNIAFGKYYLHGPECELGFVDNALGIAIKYKSIEAAFLLINSGLCNLDYQFNKKSPTVLIQACTSKLEKIAYDIISNGCNTNLKCNSKTALIVCCDKKLSKLAKTIIDLGCNKDIEDKDGNRAIDHAAMNSLPSVIIKLIRHGTDLSNGYGEKMVKYAKRRKWTVIVEELEKRGF